MNSSRHVDASAYNTLRDPGNPLHWAGFMESVNPATFIQRIATAARFV